MSPTHLSSSRCAACRCLRRKCTPDCILAPHFPPTNLQRFASVHKVFGAANITKMLEQVPENMRGQAADCIVFEAVTRLRDPVYGSVGIISQLQQQITQVQNEILKIQGEIALENAHQCQLQPQTMLHLHQLGESSEVGPSFELHQDTINGEINLRLEGSRIGQSCEELGDSYLYNNFYD